MYHEKVFLQTKKTAFWLQMRLTDVLPSLSSKSEENCVFPNRAFVMQQVLAISSPCQKDFV